MWDVLSLHELTAGSRPGRWNGKNQVSVCVCVCVCVSCEKKKVGEEKNKILFFGVQSLKAKGHLYENGTYYLLN